MIKKLKQKIKKKKNYQEFKYRAKLKRITIKFIFSFNQIKKLINNSEKNKNLKIFIVRELKDENFLKLK